MQNNEFFRFEAEISVEQSALMHQQTMARPVIGVNTYNQVQQQLQQIAPGYYIFVHIHCWVNQF